MGIRLFLLESGEGVVVITSHMSDASKAAAMLSRNPHWLLALLPAMLLVIPATAWGDIYKWTDEQGRTYYSDLSRRPPGRQRTSLWWRRKSNPRLRSRHCLPGLKLWSVSNKLSNIRCRHLQLRRRLPTPAITRQHRFRRLHLRLRVITIADTTADTTVGITAAGTIPATRYITIRSPLIRGQSHAGLQDAANIPCSAWRVLARRRWTCRRWSSWPWWRRGSQVTAALYGARSGFMSRALPIDRCHRCLIDEKRIRKNGAHIPGIAAISSDTPGSALH